VACATAVHRHDLPRGRNFDPLLRYERGPAARAARLACILLLEVRPMLSTIALVLIVLWLLGLVSSYTIGGFIHVLLVVAIIMFLVRIIQGRRPI
jgi:hypothetical protein